MKTEFKKVMFTCEKCKQPVVIETDILSVSECKAQHKCRKVKNEKENSGNGRGSKNK